MPRPCRSTRAASASHVAERECVGARAHVWRFDTLLYFSNEKLSEFYFYFTFSFIDNFPLSLFLPVFAVDYVRLPLAARAPPPPPPSLRSLNARVFRRRSILPVAFRSLRSPSIYHCFDIFLHFTVFRKASWCVRRFEMRAETSGGCCRRERATEMNV